MWSHAFPEKLPPFRHSAVHLTDEDKQWISERLERVETNLLTEFHRNPRVKLWEHQAWVAHIRVSMDELHELIGKIAIAGEEADKRIAILAEAQTKTEKTLQAYLASQMRSNGGKTTE